MQIFKNNSIAVVRRKVKNNSICGAYVWRTEKKIFVCDVYKITKNNFPCITHKGKRQRRVQSVLPKKMSLKEQCLRRRTLPRQIQ